MLPILLQIGSFSGAETSLLPLVFVAMLLDSAIVSVWYVLGVFLNNAHVKSSALTEFYQVGGTALLTAIIIGLLASYSSSFFSIMGSTQLLNPTTVSALCQNIMHTSQLDMLKSDGVVLSGPSPSSSAPSTSFVGFCNMVDPTKLDSVTAMINYPLAVTGVINANLTNQTAANLDSSFVFDAFLGFLTKLSPFVRLCVAMTPPALVCQPFATIPQPSFDLNVSFTPYSGYSYIYGSMIAFGTMLTNAFTVLVAVLVSDMILVLAWPYLIFIGLVLRSTPFTRGVGGFIIAVAIGVVLFYPLTYAMEYLALGGGGGTAVQSGAGTYGYNSITTIPGSTITCPANTLDTPTCSSGTPMCSAADYSPTCSGGGTPSCQFPSSPASCNYTVNFFAEPSVEMVVKHYKCWPSAGLNIAEMEDITFMMIPFYSVAAPLISLISNGQQPNFAPDMHLPAACASGNAFKTLTAVLQAYGLIGITTYLLPIINFIITMSAILGVSGLLGGDTSLAGLAKFL